MDIKNEPKITECHNPSCGNVFKTAYSKGKTLKKYCTFVCFVSMSRIQSECAYENCSNTFEAPKSDKRKYCSKSCSASASNDSRKNKPGVDRRNGRKLTNKCGRCKEPVSSSYNYCNPCGSTRKIWELSDKVAEWTNNGPKIATYANGQLADWARDYLIVQSGEKCTRCGWGEPNPKLGRPILTVDHKDGNWKNNNYDNLVVLCYNCHSVTETWGTLNKSVGPRPRSVNRYMDNDTGFQCIDCGIAISIGATRCAKHAAQSRKTIIDWPSGEELVSLVSRIGYEATGRSIGCSGNSVRKRIKRLGYDTTDLSPM